MPAVSMRPRRTGLAGRAVLCGTVLSVAMVFFAALSMLSEASSVRVAAAKPTSVAAPGLDALRRTAPAQGGPADPGGGGNGSGGGPFGAGTAGGWVSGEGGSGPASPKPAFPGTGRATARVNCTKEVLDEDGLKAAVANAGPNDVICVKTNMPAGSVSGSPATAPAPMPTRTQRPMPTPAQTPRPMTPPRAAPTPSRVPPAAAPGQSPSRLPPVRSPDPPLAQSPPPRVLPPVGTGSAPDTSSGSSGGWYDDSTGGSSGGTNGGLFGGGSGGGSAGSGGGSGGGGFSESAVQGGSPGAGIPDQANCTKQVTDGAGLSQAITGASPGDRICITGDLGSVRLEIGRGGTERAPLAIVGNGQTVVKGITVQASNVLVDGFQVLNSQAPGIEITGNNITIRNNTVKHPTGGDFDGLRFFGNNLQIVHNTISDTTNTGGAHADCMQTFTSGQPSSENVLIDGNRCENIANQCLMAEGPGDVGDGGGGDGTSAHWTWSNNICDFGASQGLMIEAVQNVTIRNNLFDGNGDKAIGLDIGSTGAQVSANIVGTGIGHEIGMDDKSRQGYQGPQPGGGP